MLATAAPNDEAGGEAFALARNALARARRCAQGLGLNIVCQSLTHSMRCVACHGVAMVLHAM
eukprot:2717153-Pleurochrysis_carterae.AAC.1